MGQQSGSGGQQKGGQPPQLTGTGQSTLTGTAPIQNSTTPAGQQYNNANAMKTSYSDYLSSLLGNENMQQVGNAGNSPYANTPNPIPQSTAPSYMQGAFNNVVGGAGGQGGKQGKGGQPPQPGGLPGQQSGSQTATAGALGGNLPQGFDPSASYETNLAKYRQLYPNQDNPQWLQALAPQQAMWKNANPGMGDNPTGPAYDPRTPTTRANTTTPAAGGYTPAPGQNGQVTSDYGAPGSERRKLFDAAFNTAGTGDNAGTMGDTSTEAGRTAMFGEIGSARRAAFDKAFASMNGAAPGAGGGTPQQGFSNYTPDSGLNAYTTTAGQTIGKGLSVASASTPGATYTLPKGNYRQDPNKPGNIIGPNGQSVPGFMGDPIYNGMQKVEGTQRTDFLNKSYADRANYFNQLDNDRDRQDFLSNPNNKDLNQQFTKNFPGGWQAYKQWVGTAYTGDPNQKGAAPGGMIQAQTRPGGVRG